MNKECNREKCPNRSRLHTPLKIEVMERFNIVDRGGTPIAHGLALEDANRFVDAVSAYEELLRLARLSLRTLNHIDPDCNYSAQLKIDLRTAIAKAEGG